MTMPEKKPKPKILTLPDYLNEKGASGDNADRFLKGRAGLDDYALTRAEIGEGSELALERDADLMKTRQLVHASLQKKSGDKPRGFFAVSACQYAVETLALRFGPESRIETVHKRDPAEELSRFSVCLLANSEVSESARTNALMTAVDVLAQQQNLTLERAVSVVRETVGEPRGYESKTRKINRRLHRIEFLTWPKNDLKRTQDLLDLFLPWETAQHSAERETRQAKDAVLRATEQVKQREVELEAARSRISALVDELSELGQKLDEERDQKRNVKAHSSADVSRLRSRSLSFLNSRLKGLLETAKEAAEVEPPVIQVTVRHIGRAIQEIEGEGSAPS